jgi:glyoxylase-like metal-dependent hydrolase (beta-lactamase superfamily II)
MCPASRRFVQGDGGVFEKGLLVAHCLLVELDTGLLLVDTGLGRADIAEPRKRLGTGFMLAARPRRDFLGTAYAQVRALGFQADDVRDIVLTHLDLDHAGGLADFPDARVHIYEPELRAMEERRTSNEKLRYRTVQFSHGPKWSTHKVSGDLWFGFEAVRALADDVFMVPLVGHSRGHTGVAVRKENGWLLHAGDAYFHHGEMKTPPSCPVGLSLFQAQVAMDDGARRKNQERLREFVIDHGDDVRVFSAHCPVEFAALAGKRALPPDAVTSATS